MAECIERDKLLYEFREIMPDIGVNELADELYNVALNLPAADVEEVKHGKWIQEQIKIENMSIVRYRNTCSECGGKADFLLRELHYSYCPHCGAKMDLED